MAENKENITLNIEGMTCANCALGISKTLENKGLKDVNVSFSTGEASFSLEDKSQLPAISESINKLGYKVVSSEKAGDAETHTMSSIEKKFYISLIFAIPLFSHMFLPFAFLQNPWVQLGLCLPVFIIGAIHFGKSAWGSLKSGVPNMDVLIIVGSTAAFFYSLAGMILFYNRPLLHHYLFFETAATIITLVLMGNVMEHRSVKQTTTAIKDLSAIQQVKAKKVMLHDGKEHLHEVDYKDIKVNDLLQVNTGDKIAVDGVVTTGDATIDESMISGESVPVEKSVGDKVIGGTIIVSGNIRMKAESVGGDTVLSKIIDMVKKAQQSKPNIQKLGDKVSAIFVPAVLSIAALTFILAHFVFDIGIQKALMNSIAVLVISCPCAMGLATPTAVMVGIGRAAKNGILIKGGSTLEEFAKIKNIVFDKTGTLTTGDFKIKQIDTFNSSTENDIKDILFNLEQHSSHPIAQSIVSELKTGSHNDHFTDIKEEKGVGIAAKDKAGNHYRVGSYKIVTTGTANDHDVYVIKNDELIGAVKMEDNIKSHASDTIKSLHQLGINTVMLSGDRKQKCDELSIKLGIDKTFSEQLPNQKLEQIDNLVKQAPTAMVGDGINDAPALAKADVGVSLSNATQVAIQSAQIILLKGKDLSQLNEAVKISKATLTTIKQNLFWAFFYNVIAIPFAALGFLNPMIGALAMALSDVIVVGNSIRLKSRKI